MTTIRPRPNRGALSLIIDDDTVPNHPLNRVAVLSDVHGNVPALRAVLAEVAMVEVDLIVFPGDLTWGPEPQETIEAVRALGGRTLLVRGNADRAVLEFARGERRPETERDIWMARQHSDSAVDFLARSTFDAVVDVVGLGPARFCHGSPRCDTECVTPATSAERFADLAAGVPESVIVTGHTHLQFDRRVGVHRSINPGSVGLPYHLGEPGTAYWALLGPGVELRQTRYDVEQAVRTCVESGDPRGQLIAGLLRQPPTPDEVIAHSESVIFSD